MSTSIRCLCRSEAILEEIRKDIVAGKFVAGEHLGEVDLAQRYGASRTPVREALLALMAMGLVERAGTRGCKVANRALDQCCPDCGSESIRKLTDAEGTVYFCRHCRRAWQPD